MFSFHMQAIFRLALILKYQVCPLLILKTKSSNKNGVFYLFFKILKWFSFKYIYTSKSFLAEIQWNLYIKDTQWKLKMCPLLSSCSIYVGSNYMHGTFMENETVLYRQWFEAGLTVHKGMRIYYVNFHVTSICSESTFGFCGCESRMSINNNKPHYKFKEGHKQVSQRA